MNFERGLNPKEAMKIGKYAKPKRVRCLKNQYSKRRKKLRFKRNAIYHYVNMSNGYYTVYDDLMPNFMAESHFKEYFEIYD